VRVVAEPHAIRLGLLDPFGRSRPDQLRSSSASPPSAVSMSLPCDAALAQLEQWGLLRGRAVLGGRLVHVILRGFQETSIPEALCHIGNELL
jgi:hypothetical protein